MAESSESYGKELAKEAGKTAVKVATTAVVSSVVGGFISVVGGFISVVAGFIGFLFEDSPGAAVGAEREETEESEDFFFSEL